MRNILKKKFLLRYSRQIVLKNIGVVGQKKLINSKVLIIGLGGLGCPVADLLSRAGVGLIGAFDYDKINLSNIHRQTLFSTNDVGKFKTHIVKKKISLINNEVKVIIYNKKANEKNLLKIIKKYDVIVDGSDNFKTKFLLNKLSLKFKKKLIVGAISKFDGHIFTFNFALKKTPCLKCFYQSEPLDDILNCESEGILGPTANIIGSIQANEVLKAILGISSNLTSKILILDLLKLDFRKVLFKKKRDCICKN
tara:strand:- start:1529 stop:2284 length:756 start_codon:yes stop_codon:yes gene_type:complete